MWLPANLSMKVKIGLALSFSSSFFFLCFGGASRLGGGRLGKRPHCQWKTSGEKSGTITGMAGFFRILAAHTLRHFHFILVKRIFCIPISGGGSCSWRKQSQLGMMRNEHLILDSSGFFVSLVPKPTSDKDGQ
jgi:hypothetical protein